MLSISLSIKSGHGTIMSSRNMIQKHYRDKSPGTKTSRNVIIRDVFCPRGMTLCFQVSLEYVDTCIGHIKTLGLYRGVLYRYFGLYV